MLILKFYEMVHRPKFEDRQVNSDNAKMKKSIQFFVENFLQLCDERKESFYLLKIIGMFLDQDILK